MDSKVIAIDTATRKTPRRYKIQSDGRNFYFVEVGMEAEFEAFLDSLYESVGYEGHDYSKNVVEIMHFSKPSKFTFTDPRNE